MTLVAGVDGCKGGWAVASAELNTKGEFDTFTLRVAYDFQTVMSLSATARAIVVDIPIGLPEATVRGGRTCDQEARSLLKPLRSSSVFNPPIRRMLSMSTYDEARVCGLSAQCWALLPKIREVDFLMNPDAQGLVLESHPEIIFATASGSPLSHPKKTIEGRTQRLQLLTDRAFQADTSAVFEHHRKAVPKTLAADDDIIDAYALLWLAGQKVLGHARTIPGNPPRDSRGLRMEMWCV